MSRYKMFSELVDFSEFGVPQRRNRFILVAIRNGDPALTRLRGKSPFEKLRNLRKAFLFSKRLRVCGPDSRGSSMSISALVLAVDFVSLSPHLHRARLPSCP